MLTHFSQRYPKLPPGLRAGGGVAVGLAGEDSAGYSSGNGLLSAFGMGWIVGNGIAAGADHSQEQQMGVCR